MKEILKNKLFINKWDAGLGEMIRIKTFHIYKQNKTIYIDAPFPVNKMKKLRFLLNHNRIEYNNIIIGKPYI